MKNKAKDLQAYWVILTENGSSHIFEERKQKKRKQNKPTYEGL